MGRRAVSARLVALHVRLLALARTMKDLAHAGCGAGHSTVTRIDRFFQSSGKLACFAGFEATGEHVRRWTRDNASDQLSRGFVAE